MALPMPQPTRPPLPLPEYKVLSFDVYGTLVQYKAHILRSFYPLIERLPSSSSYRNHTPAAANVPGTASRGEIEFLKLFQKVEDTIKLEKPVKRFDEILSEIWRRVACELNVSSSEDEALSFGNVETISNWPSFSGYVDALKRLQKHYRLVALSNIDRFAWDITVSSPTSRLGEVKWCKVFTAEDYSDDATRADDSKLETLVKFCASEGVDQEHILHIAQSLGHDQAPAKRLGLSSVWLIGDGPIWGKEAESKMALEKGLVGYGWRFPGLEQFADFAEQDWSGQQA